MISHKAVRKRGQNSPLRAAFATSQIRQALADYMRSEGCSCCRDDEGYEKHKARLAKLLRVPRYSDGSGFDFARFRTKD